MERLASWGWRRFGARYFTMYAAFELVSAVTISLSSLGLLTLYEGVSWAAFLRIALFACACMAVSLAVAMKKVVPKAVPLLRWVRGQRGAEGAPEAWRS